MRTRTRNTLAVLGALAGLIAIGVTVARRLNADPDPQMVAE